MFGRRAREINKTLYYDNKINYFMSPHVGVIPALIPDYDPDIPVTNTVYSTVMYQKKDKKNRYDKNFNI